MMLAPCVPATADNRKENISSVEQPTTRPTILNNQFVLHSLLGKGGFGEVYYATDLLNHNAPVAIKFEYFKPNSNDKLRRSMTKLGGDYFQSNEGKVNSGGSPPIPNIKFFENEKETANIRADSSIISQDSLDTHMMLNKHQNESKAIKAAARACLVGSSLEENAGNDFSDVSVRAPTPTSPIVPLVGCKDTTLLRETKMMQTMERMAAENVRNANNSLTGCVSTSSSSSVNTPMVTDNVNGSVYNHHHSNNHEHTSNHSLSVSVGEVTNYLPYMVHPLYFGQEKNYQFLVMSLKGPSLKQLLNVYQAFSLKSVALVGLQLLYHLEQIHKLGHLHRDIKPENIVLGIKPGCEQAYFQKLNDFYAYETSVKEEASAKIKNLLARRDDAAYANVKDETWKLEYNDIVREMKHKINQKHILRNVPFMENLENRFYFVDFGLTCAIDDMSGDYSSDSNNNSASSYQNAVNCLLNANGDYYASLRSDLPDGQPSFPPKLQSPNDIPTPPFRSIKHKKPLVGTMQYASLNTHYADKQTYRDDLEQMLYVLIHLFRGELPWTFIINKKSLARAKVEEEVGKMKRGLSIRQICTGCPEEIVNLLFYVRNLRHNEVPDYRYMRHQFYAMLFSIYGKDSISGDHIFYDVKSNDQVLTCSAAELFPNSPYTPGSKSGDVNTFNIVDGVFDWSPEQYYRMIQRGK